MLDEAMAWWYHAAAFLYITGLVLSLGVATARVLLSRVPDPRAAFRVVGPGAMVAASLLLVAGVTARLFAQVQMAFGEVGGITPAFTRLIVFETPWGWGWRWQAATAAALLLASTARWLAPVRPAPSTSLRASGPAGPVGPVGPAGPAGPVLALSAAVAAALTGHAMAFPELTALMVPLHALHAAGAGLWMGTLAVLVLAMVTVRRDAGHGVTPRQAAALTFARFSSLAVVAVGVMALTGLIIGVLHLGTWSALWGTAYGRMLLLKVGVFMMAGACGAYNWLRVRPALERDDEIAGDPTMRLRRVGGLEVGLGVVVLALTSILASLPMPAEE